jgi:predicted GIY-YIG superfamily endonuclease
MGFNSTTRNGFTEAGILASAPRASGVYGIFNGNEWIYIGEAADMEARLFDHLRGNSDQSSRISRRSPTGFLCEPCPVHLRLAREQALIRELNPTCNRT